MLDKDTMLYFGRQVLLRASEERYADSEAEAEHARLAAQRRAAEDEDRGFCALACGRVVEDRVQDTGGPPSCREVGGESHAEKQQESMEKGAS
jgi:hypothetical protein